MNRQLLVLGCSQAKRTAPGVLPAIDRYDGSSYRVLRSFLRQCQWPNNLSVAVLSAKYGLVGAFANIELYDQRMTPEKAQEMAPECLEILSRWSVGHTGIHFSLGKDYLPAVTPAIEKALRQKAHIMEGSIGVKLSQIKTLLFDTGAPPRIHSECPEPGSQRLRYFLPDWDDLLDENFDFEADEFSGDSRKERNDKHCCVLMKPKRMCDGVLVSLAQHMTSKGPLRRIVGTETSSLAPKNMRKLFGLSQNQWLFGDCGAFSYVNESQPSISVEQAVALYELYGFDFGASVDHIPVRYVIKGNSKVELSDASRRARIKLTKENAFYFFELVRKRQANFMPVGTIQAEDAEDYARTVQLYHEIGYRHIALGGLVPRSDSSIENIVSRVMSVVSTLTPRPWVHLFGVFRPKLQALFRQLNIDSFDSATYFRKAWLRSNQNYLATNGKWYAALRVPMTTDPRTLNRLETSQIDIADLQRQETDVLTILSKFDRDRATIKETLDAVIAYDHNLTRSSDIRSMKEIYKRTLKDRPWRFCDCPFCSEAGIHVLIFRGSNRNKRRGAHNTLMLYRSLHTVP